MMPLMPCCYPFADPAILSAASPVVQLNVAEAQTVRIQPEEDTAVTVRIHASSTEPIEAVHAKITVQNYSAPITGTMLISSAEPASGKANIIGQYHDAYRKKAGRRTSSKQE